MIAAAELPDAPRYGLQPTRERSTDEHDDAERDERDEEPTERDQQPTKTDGVVSSLRDGALRRAHADFAPHDPDEANDLVGHGDAIDDDQGGPRLDDDLGRPSIDAAQDCAEPLVGQWAPVARRVRVGEHEALRVGDEEGDEIGIDAGPRGQRGLERRPVFVTVGSDDARCELVRGRAQVRRQLCDGSGGQLRFERMVEPRRAGAEHEADDRRTEDDEGERTARQPPDEATRHRPVARIPRICSDPSTTTSSRRLHHALPTVAILAGYVNVA